MRINIFLISLLIICTQIRVIQNWRVIKKVKYEIKVDGFQKIAAVHSYKAYRRKKKKKKKLIYTNINTHNNIDNLLNNESLLKLKSNYQGTNNSDENKDIIRSLRKIKNLINKYNLKLSKEDYENFKNRTKHLVLYKYNFVKRHYILLSNKLKNNIVIYGEKLKTYYNPYYFDLAKNNFNKFLYSYVYNIPFFNKSKHLSKIISYNCVNLFFLLFTFLYFKSNYIYAFFKKKYAFIGEFKTIKTDKLVKIHNLSTFLFFFYKFIILRFLYIFNSYHFLSNRLYTINNLIHFFFYSYISFFSYLLIQANWGSFYLMDLQKSKLLGTVILCQLFLIYIRLFFQNNLSFLRKWTDEQFFNKYEIFKSIKENKKIDFYVYLLNKYDFLKKLYLGNNKIYDVALHLHKYKYLLDFIFPIHSFFYLYLAHSIYFYLNYLSFAGIYVSSFSFFMYLLKIISNKIDMYYLNKI
ncbi:apicoplast integral membrane protein, putative [Hepatocystis sp. ex Piliocolobus tephrosceles]|nr:apicoplast integral membrane protein, putative [Hepatocystis sp. ex Piliocolobus tephrosceles]